MSQKNLTFISIKDKISYMIQITVPKTEYEQLSKQAAAYRKFTAEFFESIIKDPIDQIIKDFRNTTLYTEKFLEDLEDGLRKSSYSKKYADKTA